MDAALHQKRILLILATLILVIGVPVIAGSTELHLVKYANDRTTVLSEKTLTYGEMRDTLPIRGDGTTHYYLQGPVFVDDPDPVKEETLRWNPEEDTNIQTKDMGAVRGTDLKDLCRLVGGMSPGDTLTAVASDGMTRDFAYRNIYTPPSRQGPVVLTWEKDGKYPDTGYDEGMRLAFFADNSVNPWGIHAFGNYDWHEAASEEYWYYYHDGAEKYPTTTGLSVKYVSEIRIYSAKSMGKGSSGTLGSSEEDVQAENARSSGFKGSELFSYASGTLNGTIRFLSDPNSTPVLMNNRVRTYRIPVDLSPDSNLALARLYLYVSQSRDTRTKRGVVPSILVRFNGNLIGPDQVYLDADGDEGGNVSATYAYDVKPYLKNGTMTVTLENPAFEEKVFIVDDAVILVAYEEEQADPVRYWIDEGCDVIRSDPKEGIFPEDACTTGRFAGTVNISEAGAADLLVVATGFDRMNSTEHRVTFNTLEWYGIFDNLQGLPKAAPCINIPVASGLNTTFNAVSVESAIRKEDADYLVTRNAVLMIHANASPENAALPEPGGNMTLPAAGETLQQGQHASAAPPFTRSYRLSLHSNPEGALIIMNGKYLGTTTPFALDVPAGSEYTIRMEREGFVPAHSTVNVTSDMTLRENLYSNVYSTKGRSAEMIRDRNATSHGGLYIHSRPSPAAISVDGVLMPRRTPTIFYGIEEGTHIVRLSLVYTDPDLADSAEIVFDAREVAVLPSCIVPVDVAANTSPLRDVIIDSRGYRGESFTVNGNTLQKILPARAHIPRFDSFITVFTGQSYISYPLAAELDDGSYFLIEPRDHYNISLFVDSYPKGAEIFIDGFRTGYSTPFTLKNLSEGPHRIMVTKPGYIPDERDISLPQTSYPPPAASVSFILDEYENGFLRVTSNPAGASILLDGLPTNEVTPWLFSSVPTGDHSVTVSSGNVTKTYHDVTVNALDCMNVSVDLRRP